MDHPQVAKNQSAHYFGRTAIDFEKSYKVKDLRVSKGFSDRDLSFLLGFRALYVRDVENPLHKLIYKAKETNYLQHIFDCSLDQVMYLTLPDLNYDLYILATANSEGTNSYEIFKEDVSGRYVLLHSFTELAKDTQILPKCNTSSEKVQEYISSLQETDYFLTPKTGLEIFRKCIEHFKGHLKPTFIEEAIKNINKSSSTKITIGKNEMRRFVYSTV
ncbi:hypothetical protein SAMN06265348_1088 [Pedobacter westerhofensis]|uniref:Uncharacterized protein n=1 Tax=Pedobacter westerhofensis TaxID=425512 RepID=A0A521EEG1_9SPHI|nr:hypothetical protein [Pedobacter westerhofensis]SMO82242.1 hypothetical protein SAMN06265348_1088 [Pedobacter westerhofensis]